MSNIPLTTIQELIERSLFERVRLELVAKGYLPDITTFADTAIGIAAYEAAISAIVTSKGFAIELYSGGTNRAKVIKKIPRIVIKPGSFLPGALGGDPHRIYEDQGIGLGYKALVTPPQTVDFYLNIHIVAETSAQERVLGSFIALAVPRRSYIPFYTDNTQTFFARYLNYYSVDNVDEGLIEKIYAYEVPDAWDRENEEVATISKMTEITLHTNIQKYMDGEWGSDSTPMVIT